MVAGVLQSIETITYTWSASPWHQQAINIFLLYDSTRVTCRNTLLYDSDDHCFVSQTCFNCQYHRVPLCVQLVT